MAARARVIRQEAKDRTVYWTLSFYIPVDKLAPFADGLKGPPDKIANGLAAALDDAAHLTSATTSERIARTEELRQAIDPLFNDVADRSRVGVVEDFLFAGLDRKDVTLTMPPTVDWMTEGKRFSTKLADSAKDRSRPFQFRSFWYAHGNGSVSWHVSLWHCYKPYLAEELKGGVPVTYYLLSLLQKLAWPKEFGSQTPDDNLTTDDLVGIKIGGAPFWAFIEEQFCADAAVALPLMFGSLNWTPLEDQPPKLFDVLVEPKASIEIPGLKYRDSRSSFFIHDKAFFQLIQPEQDGVPVRRGSRVLDPDFVRYPELIKAQSGKTRTKCLLNDTYWTSIHQPLTAASAKRKGSPSAAERLTYLFLAGFNQNIIDFMNQEASEVLDSLDPIYPSSESQEQEGFFVRYANPRSMITYVPRSRTLEVGNDFIGTCPYAFLIHALSMHNEALTREQEGATLLAIRQVKGWLDLGTQDKAEKAEKLINATRLAAFWKYDQHRYANPFRYDTEREVFDSMEQLRGTSRLRIAHDAALEALDESTRDVQRILQEAGDHRERKRARRLSDMLSFLGFTGLAGLAFGTDQYVRSTIGPVLGIAMPPWLWVSIQVLLLLAYWIVPALLFLKVVGWRGLERYRLPDLRRRRGSPDHQ